MSTPVGVVVVVRGLAVCGGLGVVALTGMAAVLVGDWAVAPGDAFADYSLLGTALLAAAATVPAAAAVTGWLYARHRPGLAAALAVGSVVTGWTVPAAVGVLRLTG